MGNQNWDGLGNPILETGPGDNQGEKSGMLVGLQNVVI